MKQLFLILTYCFLSGHILYAKEQLDVRLNPERPVKGESFEIIFDLYTDKDNTPSIDFDPFGVEVLGQGTPSFSTQTTYINGDLTVKRKISIPFEVMASNSGEVSIQNIKVQVGDVKLTHPGVRISVLNAPQRPKSIFLRLELDKTEAYVNESIKATYYLYRRVSLVNMEIKEFPKFPNFLKRYHQENGKEERVSFNGEAYIRTPIYRLQLFPEKPGKINVGSMKLNVSYSMGGSNPFGSFGIGLGRTASKTLISKKVAINVLPVPVQGMPKSFTGLVGSHKVDFSINKTKFVANEAIEIKVGVEGEGALELYDLKHLISNSSLEEFDTISELEVRDDYSARKNFEMTYIGRGNAKIAAQKVELAFFNSTTKQFEVQSIEIPALEIRGTTTTKNERNLNPNAAGPNNNELSPISRPNATSPKEEVEFLFAPIYKFVNSWIYHSESVNIFLIALIFLSLIFHASGPVYRFLQSKSVSMDNYAAKTVTYGQLYGMLSSIERPGNLENKIKKSNLSSGAKKYYLSLVHNFDNNYVNNSNQDIKEVRVKKKYLKEIQKILVKQKHNDNKRSYV